MIVRLHYVVDLELPDDLDRRGDRYGTTDPSECGQIEGSNRMEDIIEYVGRPRFVGVDSGGGQ